MGEIIQRLSKGRNLFLFFLTNQNWIFHLGYNKEYSQKASWGNSFLKQIESSYPIHHLNFDIQRYTFFKREIFSYILRLFNSFNEISFNL